MPINRRDGLSDAQIRMQTDAVINTAIRQLDNPKGPQNYADFGAFFVALMEANDNIGQLELIERINSHPKSSVARGKRDPYSESSIHEYRYSRNNPSYGFIRDLIASNALRIPLKRLQPGGDARAALYAMGGMVEFTEESRDAHYDRVFKHAKQITRGDDKPNWATSMHDLFLFHTQGDRTSIPIIQKEIRKKTGLFESKERLNSILQCTTHPTQEEREAIYDYLKLPEEQRAWYEGGISKGLFAERVHAKPKNEAFGEVLDGILNKLREEGVTTTMLSDASATGSPNKKAFSDGDLSLWRRGKHGITMPKLRKLIRVLKSFRNEEADKGPTQADLEALCKAAGYSLGTLIEHASDVIYQITPKSDIKVVLKRLREASDVEMTIEQLANDPLFANRPVKITAQQINSWENSLDNIPSPEQSREIADRIDIYLEHKLRARIGQDGVNAVVRAAERSREHWDKRSVMTARVLASRAPRPDYLNGLAPSSWRAMVTEGIPVSDGSPEFAGRS